LWAANNEHQGDHQGLDVNTVKLPPSSPDPEQASAVSGFKSSVSPRAVNFGAVSPSPIRVSDRTRTAGTFSGQRLQPEVLTPTVLARPFATLAVLDKLSQAATPATPLQAAGRRVHIGKLHITVQRPPAQALSPQPEAAEAGRTVQADEQA